MNEWISVKDRLPVEGHHVLLAAPQEKSGRCAYAIGYFLCKAWWGEILPHEFSPHLDAYYEGAEIARISSDSISHWMPIPMLVK